MGRLAGRRCGCPGAFTGQVGTGPAAVLASCTTAIHEGTRLTQLLRGGNIDSWEKNSCRRGKKMAFGCDGRVARLLGASWWRFKHMDPGG